MSKKERHIVEDLKHEVMSKENTSTKEARITARNKAIEAVFEHLQKAHPEWRLDPLYEATATYFPPIGAITVQDVITGNFDRKRSRRNGVITDPNQMSIFDVSGVADEDT
jgi:hypothetical protein